MSVFAKDFDDAGFHEGLQSVSNKDAGMGKTIGLRNNSRIGGGKGRSEGTRIRSDGRFTFLIGLKSVTKLQTTPHAAIFTSASGWRSKLNIGIITP